MRTFVISDAHGFPDLILSALAHGGFRPGEDALIYAGDLVDRGPDAGACIDIVERSAAEVLLGNHDVALLLRLPVLPQDPANARFRLLFADRTIRNAAAPGAWKLAACVDDVLITHAGVSQEYLGFLHGDCEGDLALFADRLNELFTEEVLECVEGGARRWPSIGILGSQGPLWYRPGAWGIPPPLPCAQVAGHTPPLEGMAERRFYMIDPGTAWGAPEPGFYRYAVIEGGVVTVEEGRL